VAIVPVIVSAPIELPQEIVKAPEDEIVDPVSTGRRATLPCESMSSRKPPT